MIQSDKFDSLFMEIKKLANNSLNFIIKRFIELFGLVILLISIFSLVALFYAAVVGAILFTIYVILDWTPIKNINLWIGLVILGMLGFISHLLIIFAIQLSNLSFVESEKSASSSKVEFLFSFLSCINLKPFQQFLMYSQPKVLF